MKRISLSALCTLTIAILIFSGMSAQAQVPFLSDEGIEPAESAAKATLADDVILVGIVTLGKDPISGGDAYDPETGTSLTWGYIFFSPSRNQSTALVLAQPISGIYVNIVESMGHDTVNVGPRDVALDLSGQYAVSDGMAEMLNANATYQAHIAGQHNDMPAVVSLGKGIQGNATGLPNNFPTDKPIWTIDFRRLADSSLSMTCFVASGTGESYCVEILGPASVLAHENGAAEAAVTISPNPITGRARVDVAVPDGMNRSQNVQVALYTATGEKVLDLTESFARNDYRHVEIETDALPAGLYYCRASGSGWSGATGVIVQK